MRFRVRFNEIKGVEDLRIRCRDKLVVLLANPSFNSLFFSRLCFSSFTGLGSKAMALLP